MKKKHPSLQLQTGISREHQIIWVVLCNIDAKLVPKLQQNRIDNFACKTSSCCLFWDGSWPTYQVSLPTYLPT